MSDKILLVIPGTQTNAMQYFRQLLPHAKLNAERCQNVMGLDDKQLQNYKAVHFSRELPIDAAERLQRMGLKIVFDVDDYWHEPKHHILYHEHKKVNYGSTIEEMLGYASVVTTTTTYLAEKIKPFNSKIEIIPNAIDPSEPQFQVNRKPSDLTRFGWIGGIHHIKDVELLHEPFRKLWHDKQSIDKFQLCLGGFNTKKANINENGEVHYTDDNPVYKYYEYIFTEKYKAVAHIPGYMEYLLMYSDVSSHIMNGKPYRRLWGQDVYNYGRMYNEIDVSLAPLIDDNFNRSKSQLKLIEAGFMKCALICSPVEPYLIDGINNKNVLFARNAMEWYTHMRRLIKEPNMVQDLSGELHETVQKYHINNSVELLKQIYEC